MYCIIVPYVGKYIPKRKCLDTNQSTEPSTRLSDLKLRVLFSNLELTYPIRLQRLSTMFLLLPEAVGTFALVEDVGGKLSAIRSARHGARTQGPLCHTQHGSQLINVKHPLEPTFWQNQHVGRKVVYTRRRVIYQLSAKSHLKRQNWGTTLITEGHGAHTPRQTDG